MARTETPRRIVYAMGGTTYEVTQPEVLDVITKARRLDISPGDAMGRLKELLFPKNDTGLEKQLDNLMIYKGFCTEVYNPANGRASSLAELYAEKHVLSGKLGF